MGLLPVDQFMIKVSIKNHMLQSPFQNDCRYCFGGSKAHINNSSNNYFFSLRKLPTYELDRI